MRAGPGLSLHFLPEGGGDPSPFLPAESPPAPAPAPWEDVDSDDSDEVVMAPALPAKRSAPLPPALAPCRRPARGDSLSAEG